MTRQEQITLTQKAIADGQQLSADLTAIAELDASYAAQVDEINRVNEARLADLLTQAADQYSNEVIPWATTLDADAPARVQLQASYDEAHPNE